MKYCLLTGATGLLGRYLMRDMLLRDQPLVVLVRPTRYETAEQRVDAVLKHWEQEWRRWLPRPVVFAGDINAPNLGLSSEQCRWLEQHCDRVLHSAASLAFQQEGEEPWRSNVEGLKNVLDFCQAHAIRKFLHVSSCYVCGLRTGTVREDELLVGQEFGNIYEESKAHGETLVQGADFLDCYTIFRPSIIVGDSETGFSTTFHGFYTPLRLLSAIAEYVPHDIVFSINHMENLGLEGHERKNFVPVQWVSDAMLTLIERERPQNRTFALAMSHPVTVDRMYQQMEDAIRSFQPSPENAEGSELSLDFESPEVQAMVGTYLESFAVYQSYWRDDPEFDLTNTAEVIPDKLAEELSEDCLQKLCQYAIESQFSWIPKRAKAGDFVARDLLSTWQHDSHAKQVEPWTNARSGLELTITGPGGGCWTLTENGSGLRFVEGAVGAESKARLNSSTFQELVEGQLTIEDAIAGGRLMVSGTPEGIEIFGLALAGGSVGQSLTDSAG